MSRFDYPVPLPPLSLHGALSLGGSMLRAAEPIEDRPGFLIGPLLRLDEAVRELRGAMQVRGQLRLAHPSRQQYARADVEAQSALDNLLAALRSYLLRVAILAEDDLPETAAMARVLVAPMLADEVAQVMELPQPIAFPLTRVRAA